MLVENKLALRFTILALLLAFSVILLGAITRLKDAGLGCPDWPGCYGQLIVPHQTNAIAFSKYTFNTHKAWAEMIHRYAAATLILLISASSILIIHKRKLPQQPTHITFALLLLLFFQGLLGKWTVTLQLNPFVVMSHLLGGLGLLSLLWMLILRLMPIFKSIPTNPEKNLRPWLTLGLFIIIIQISLGGWTSSNYAAFVCPDFPSCQGHWWPTMNFTEGFRLWTDTHRNFEGGLLSSEARTAIQITHRLGALITFLYLSFLLWKLKKVATHKILRRFSLLLLILLSLQITLGILNVIWLLPLLIAVAHNGIAALLLLTLLSLRHYTTRT